MRTFLLLSFSLFLFSCGVNRNVYQSQDIKQFGDQKTIAVLPFRITQTGHKAKNVSEQEIKQSSEELGYVFQESLHSYLLRHTGRRKKEPVADFQSLQKTNALLKNAGLDIEQAYQKTPEDLAQLLGVDAVLMTTLSKEKNFSDGLAYGLAAGQAVLNGVGQNTIMLGGINATDINLNSSLYEKEKGKLLWKTFRQGGTSLPGNVNNLAAFYSNWIASKFPFRS